VLSRAEVRAVLGRLDWPSRLIGCLLYGAGVRLLECVRLRTKEVDFGANQVVVRRGKGAKDRVTLLLGIGREPLRVHLDGVRRLHERDLHHGAGWVELPASLGRKYPNGGREWAWQWVSPATRSYVEAETG
jgi:integrase